MTHTSLASQVRRASGAGREGKIWEVIVVSYAQRFRVNGGDHLPDLAIAQGGNCDILELAGGCNDSPGRQ